MTPPDGKQSGGTKSEGKESKAAASSISMATSLSRYGADRWGKSFLGVNKKGHLCFSAPHTEKLDLHHAAESLAKRGIRSPYILRFPTMIEAQMKRLRDAFERARRDNQYESVHIGVYPLKVNQKRAVVDVVVRAREKLNFGLEAGSKPELLLALAQPVLPGHPIICNGYKDREFMCMAFHAAELGHEVIIVLESVREVHRFLKVASEEEWKAMPSLGVRAKLYTKGSGRWTSSAGERSKFGLTTPEILSVVQALENAELIHLLSLIHFHIGSQITQIKRVKMAVREASRIWGEIRKRCPSLTYLDLGGGIGVDYDGSHTSHTYSANYSIEEYASQVVFEISEVVADLEVPPPTIVTESGRVLVANHAVTIADLREVQGELLPVPDPSDDEHRLITELRYTLENLSTKNLEEYFHDAVDYRDEALQLFSRGYLSLEDRASAEGLFHRVRLKCDQLVSQIKRPPEEIVQHLRSPQYKFLANFSVFQSLPDAWSINQVFPAAPLSRHGREQTINAQIVDITCDSDGRVDHFAHPYDDMRHLPLHPRLDSDANYYLGFFLTGAYQDSLSNQHNLFSRCHEVIVRHSDEDMLLAGSERLDLDSGHSLEIKSGATIEDVLSAMDFDVDGVIQSLRDRHLNIETTLGKPWAMGLLQGYPYLIK